MACWIVHLQIAENLALSIAQGDLFVDESIRQISRILKQLWINGSPADGVESALDLSI
jgi:hypothetical protein